MVVSVGWLEIIAWKIGVVQFPSRSGWLSGTWLHKSHLRRSWMHRSAGWIHMMMSGDGGKGNRKQRVTLVDEATVDYRSTPMLRWQGDQWQNCGTCRTRWMTPSQCQTRSTAWSSGARLSSRCRNTLGRCSKCWTRCGLEIECQKYCGWIMATCGNPSILPDGALLTTLAFRTSKKRWVRCETLGLLRKTWFLLKPWFCKLSFSHHFWIISSPAHLKVPNSESWSKGMEFE